MVLERCKRILPGCFIVFALCFLLGTPALLAQTSNTGTVVGTVVDPSGAAVVGATVTLADPATASTRTSPTNDTGRYFFANVEPAVYNVTVTKAGFRTAKLTGQVVTVSNTL